MEEHKLVIERSFDRSINKVFKAWSDPGALKQWFAPGKMSVAELEVDFTKDGKLKVVMEGPGGDQYTVKGRYVLIAQKKQIVFTWQWVNGEEDPHESLVTVNFWKNGNSTDIRFIHENLPNAESVEQHEDGWKGCLDNLEEYLG